MSLAQACHYKNKGHGSGSATKTTTDIRRLRRVSPFIHSYICVTPPGQTKKDTDLKFGTHTPIDLI